MIRLSIIALLGIAACEAPNETVASYGGGDHPWRLVSINAAPFDAEASMILDPSGAVTGRGPCNSFTARQTVPYPWFKIEAIAATKTACSDLTAETAFFEALSAMTLSEVSGPVLILSNDTGAQMQFEPINPKR